MKKWVILFAIIASTAQADISGETRLIFPNANRFVAGNSLQGSWTEAFIDFVQFSSSMYSFLNGSPYGGYQAYQEFRQFLDAAGDKAALSRGTITLRHGSGQTAKLRFYARSDDDPFGLIKVAYPNGGTLTSAFHKQETWQGSRNAQIELSIDYNQLPPGNYPVLFYAKETNCNLCLSLTHKINVRVAPALITCSPMFPRQCVLTENALLQTENQIASSQEERRQIINSLYEQGPHKALEQLKKRLNICRHVADPSNCTDRAYDEFEGYCTRIAFGIRTRDNVCNRLNEIDIRLNNLEATHEQQLVSQKNACACGSPGGGPRN